MAPNTKRPPTAPIAGTIAEAPEESWALALTHDLPSVDKTVFAPHTGGVGTVEAVVFTVGLVVRAIEDDEVIFEVITVLVDGIDEVEVTTLLPWDDDDVTGVLAVIKVLEADVLNFVVLELIAIVADATVLVVTTIEDKIELVVTTGRVTVVDFDDPMDVETKKCYKNAKE